MLCPSHATAVNLLDVISELPKPLCTPWKAFWIRLINSFGCHSRNRHYLSGEFFPVQAKFQPWELLDRIEGKFGSSLFFIYKLGTRVLSRATPPSTQDMQYGRISLSRDLLSWSKYSMISHHHPESLRPLPVLKSERRDFSTLLLIRMLRSEDWLIHRIFPYVVAALVLSVSV